MIEVHSFCFNPFQENTYIISNREGECMIVDPGMSNASERNSLERFIAERNLKPIMLINTHCHIDHVLGNASIFQKFGLRPKIHDLERQVLNAVPRVAEMYGINYDESPNGEVIEEKKLFLGQESFEVLFVPGHSPGHIALYHSRAGVLISGDVLFRESVGRTDLPGGDADVLFKSIREVIYTLPGDTKVYPGHMEPTTVAHERMYNPFVRA